MFQNLLFSIAALFIFVEIVKSDDSGSFTVPPVYYSNCYSKDYGIFVDAGKPYQVPGKCEVVICNKKNGNALTQSCGDGPPDCRPVKGDPAKTFPECCDGCEP
ncbi:uncharacterized protein [Parasteatoda tepidariorum]|uniref:uncharacterized protein n=1 Tax=Parasteatoda tepidariorum TaxID=114398 RepID=UPI00077F9D45|nr:uncharacterized protein LOC107442585 [Parasteatoda tepidariorum]